MELQLPLPAVVTVAALAVEAPTRATNSARSERAVNFFIKVPGV
jgi:hypothetical protein